MKKSHRIVVIGGGPSGLTALYDLASRKIPAVCLEADTVVGGISRTILRRGFRFDVGGHRFFSKYPRINELWRQVLGDDFLRRPRLSRIYYNGRFFNYPLKPMNALRGLGLGRSCAILASYLRARLFPHRPEESFADWVGNRFGRRLYAIFFKTYTEKVWGIPCTEIRAEWAAQRIKGLSLATAVKNAFFPDRTGAVKTLIDAFDYPRLGPGQMYETMAEKAVALGARLLVRHEVRAIHHDGAKILEVLALGPEGDVVFDGSGFISSMPLSELVLCLRPAAPEVVRAAAKSLRYRALLTINLMLRTPQRLPDTWIYVHDPEVRMGRLQFFANWSPHLVPDPDTSSVGLEYFCWEGDELWTMKDEDLIALGRQELVRLDLVDVESVFDAFVVRMPKCYPVYDGDYSRHIGVIRDYLAGFTNLEPCGRYGLFKYNNMDHSSLTALLAVENLLGASHDVWAINADDDYHEEERAATD